LWNESDYEKSLHPTLCQRVLWKSEFNFGHISHFFIATINVHFYEFLLFNQKQRVWESEREREYLKSSHILHQFTLSLSPSLSLSQNKIVLISRKKTAFNVQCSKCGSRSAFMTHEYQYYSIMLRHCFQISAFILFFCFFFYQQNTHAQKIQNPVLWESEWKSEWERNSLLQLFSVSFILFS
jgi:hypothetical protein